MKVEIDLTEAKKGLVPLGSLLPGNWFYTPSGVISLVISHGAVTTLAAIFQEYNGTSLVRWDSGIRVVPMAEKQIRIQN